MLCLGVVQGGISGRSQWGIVRQVVSPPFSLSLPSPFPFPPKFSDKPVGGKVRSSEGEIPRLPPTYTTLASCLIRDMNLGLGRGSSARYENISKFGLRAGSGGYSHKNMGCISPTQALTALLIIHKASQSLTDNHSHQSSFYCLHPVV